MDLPVHWLKQYANHEQSTSSVVTTKMETARGPIGATTWQQTFI